MFYGGHLFRADDSVALANHNQPVCGNVLEMVWASTDPAHRELNAGRLAEAEVEPEIIYGKIARLRG